MGKKQVVIVDDDPDTTGLLKMLLEDILGVEAVPVHDEREALERITKARPAAIVIDTKIPGLDGLQLVKQLKANGSTRDIPTIVLSGSTRVEEAQQAGCDEFIGKPFELDTFLTVMRKHLPGTKS